MNAFRKLSDKVGPVTATSIVLNAGCAAAGFAFTETGPVLTVLGVNLSAVVGLYEHTQRSVGSVLAGLDRLPIDNQHLLANLPGYLRDLGYELDTAARGGLALLAKPTHEYKSEHEFFRAAASLVDRLGAGDRVTVACADSVHRWQSKAVQRWLIKNYEAVERRRVHFTRIMFSRTEDMREQALAQAMRGIRVLILGQQELQGLSGLQDIPADMGVAVVNHDRVYWHYGSGTEFRGAMIESPVVAAMVLSVLHSLEAHAEEIDRPRAV